MTSHQVNTITDTNFNSFIRNNSHVIIDFEAPWCGYCRALSPVLEVLAQKYRDSVAFGKINIDENNQLSEQFGIVTIPTLLFFRYGALRDRIIGPVSKIFIEEKISSLMR